MSAGAIYKIDFNEVYVFTLKKCTTEQDYSLAVKLTKDYMDWLDVDLCFQNIDKEFASFSDMYGGDEGVFLLGLYNGEVAGGVGLRKLEDNICEMKRLYVYDQYKRKGLGNRLCMMLIDEAKQLGYTKMRLDTLREMVSAVDLYKKLGFVEIGPYRFNPEKSVVYMELAINLK